MFDQFVTGRHNGVVVWGWATSEQLWTRQGLITVYFDHPILGTASKDIDVSELRGWFVTHKRR